MPKLAGARASAQQVDSVALPTTPAGTLSNQAFRNRSHLPVTVLLPDPVCEELLLTLAVLLAVASALRVSVTEAVRLALAVVEADAETVPV
jgi:hypothetical protein